MLDCLHTSLDSRVRGNDMNNYVNLRNEALEGRPKTPFWRNFSSKIVPENRYGLGKLALFGRASST